MDLSVCIGNGTLPYPVGLASGTFGYGSEYETLVDLSRMGAVFAKSVTRKPRPGNENPRIVETPSGLLNSIGLANIGLDKFLSQKMPLFKGFPCPVVANIAGFSEDEYAVVLEACASHDEIWGFEINISCPNVSHGGLAFGTDVKVVERLVARLRKITPKPLIVKLTPNVTDICEIARASEESGADALTCINTLVGMVVDVQKKAPLLGNVTGGLSGPAIRPVGVAIVYKVSRAVSIPVMGLGGIMTADDAIEYLLAGASFVQIGTATFVDPGIPARVVQGIEDYMKKEGCVRVSDIRSLMA